MQDPTVATCRHCRARPATSAEHLIGSAIGGRKKIAGVLCEKCNNDLGSSIDRALVDAFAALLMALGVEGDRGQASRVRAVDERGRPIMASSGLVPELLDFEPNLELGPDGTFNVEVASERAARRWIESMRRKGKTVTLRSVTEETYYSRADFTVHPGDPDAHRSLMKTALVLAARDGRDYAFTRSGWDYVRSGDYPDNVDFHCTAAEPPCHPGPGLGPVAHSVMVLGSAAKRGMRMHVRLFGSFDFAGYIDDVDCLDMVRAYAVDPLTGAAEECDRFSGEVGLPMGRGEGEIEAVTTKQHDAMTWILRVVDERVQRATIERIVRASVARHLPEGEDVSEAQFAIVVDEVARSFCRELARQGTRADDLEALARLAGRKPGD